MAFVAAVVALELVVESLQADAKLLCRLSLSAAKSTERAQNQLLLGLAQIARDWLCRGRNVAGSLQVDDGGKRPFLRAELLSQSLNLADLGPVIGADGAAPTADRRVLPVLTLDPLSFGVAGGSLAGTITLDGRHDPIQARAQGWVRKIFLEKLFPGLDPKPVRIGRIDGSFDLAGSGSSVARILGTANGKLGLVIAGGEISRLMLETIGLHLWEMLQLNITGDQVSNIRCGIADFSVKNGVMTSNALVLDTDVTTINATGRVDLDKEQLDLVLTQRTKITSPVALRTPIHVRGSFAEPRAALDKGRVLTRGVGALALGLVNPFAALLALVEAGPGMDSDCAALIRAAQTPLPGKTGNKPPAAAAPTQR